MSNRSILLAILAFVALTFGSFIYFVATWDADKEPQLSFDLNTLLPPEMPANQGITS